jgi:hypothetical protein
MHESNSDLYIDGGAVSLFLTYGAVISKTCNSIDILAYQEREMKMTLEARCKQMVNELGLPITRFCKNIKISTASYYDWQNQKLKLSDATQKRINEYLSKYGF